MHISNAKLRAVIVLLTFTAPLACGGPAGVAPASGLGANTACTKRGDVSCDPESSSPIIADFTSGALLSPNSNASVPSASLDAGSGGTKLTWASARNGDFVGAYVDGRWDLLQARTFALELGFPRGSVNTAASLLFYFGQERRSYAIFSVPSGMRRPPRLAVPILKTAMSIHGAAEWGNVTRVEVRLGRVGSGGHDAMIVFRVWANPPTPASVLLTFDDGDATQYTEAFAIMRGAGLRGTLYVNGATIGQSGKATTSQLQEMNREGWDIANHTFRHSRLAWDVGAYARQANTATLRTGASWPHGYGTGQEVTIDGCDEDAFNGSLRIAAVPDASTMIFPLTAPSNDAVARGWCHLVSKVPPDVIRTAILDNTTWLLKNGMSRATAHFAYPWGEVDDAVIDILKEQGFQTARLASPGALRSQVLALPGAVSRYHLPHYYLDNSATAATALASVDDAAASGASLIMLIHRIVPAPSSSYEFSSGEFKSLIEGLRLRKERGTISIPTITEWSNTL